MTISNALGRRLLGESGQSPEWRSIKKSLLYPIVGVLLALGAPGGLFIVRLLSSAPASVRSAVGDLVHDATTYTYLAVSTTLVFLVLGTILGKKADRLERVSSMDPLTRIPNRRHFEGQLTRELKRARRNASPLALLLIDIDHLKEINDTTGHKGGDVVLRVVADALFASCRATDVAARWGGDEFVLLAPGVDVTGGLQIAERIRETLRRASPGPEGIAPTVSIGVADVLGLDHPTIDELYAAADAALYEAKAAGRDRARVSARAP